MSGNFIARWSRLKQQAAEEDRKPRAGADPDDPRARHADADRPAEIKDRPGHPAALPAEVEPAFDPATLPSIESIVAGTDIRAFLQKGVPSALTKAALRRAWTADPAIRDFIEVAENQWDFTDPAAIPGFGPLLATDNLRQLVGQALGNLPEASDAADAPAAGVLRESPEAVASAKVPALDPPPTATHTPCSGPQPEAPAMHSQVASLPEVSDNPDTVGVAAPQHPTPAHEMGNAPRRKGHGRALPQ